MALTLSPSLSFGPSLQISSQSTAPLSISNVPSSLMIAGAPSGVQTISPTATKASTAPLSSSFYDMGPPIPVDYKAPPPSGLSVTATPRIDTTPPAITPPLRQVSTADYASAFPGSVDTLSVTGRPGGLSLSGPLLQMPGAGAKVDPIDNLYAQILGRAPDEEGKRYWSEQFGPTIEPHEIDTFVRAIKEGDDREQAERRARAMLTTVERPRLAADIFTPPTFTPSTNQLVESLGLQNITQVDQAVLAEKAEEAARKVKEQGRSQYQNLIEEADALYLSGTITSDEHKNRIEKAREFNTSVNETSESIRQAILNRDLFSISSYNLPEEITKQVQDAARAVYGKDLPDDRLRKVAQQLASGETTAEKLIASLAYNAETLEEKARANTLLGYNYHELDPIEQKVSQLKEQYGFLNKEANYKYAYDSEKNLDRIFRQYAKGLEERGVENIYDVSSKVVEKPEPIRVIKRPVYDANDNFTGQFDYFKFNESGEGDVEPLTEFERANVKEIQNDDEGSITTSISMVPRQVLFNNKTGEEISEVGDGGVSNFGAVGDHKGQALLRMSFTPDGVPIYYPVYEKKVSTLQKIAPIAAVFAMPFAPQIGSALFGLTGTAATVAGATAISAATQLATTRTIDPGRLLLTAGTAYVGANMGFTGADIASDASQLVAQAAEKGLSTGQIFDSVVQVLEATGINAISANLYAGLAVAGVPASVAPVLAGGLVNGTMSAFQAKLDDRNVSDAFGKGFGLGASGEISNKIVDDIVGKDNIRKIAQELKLTPDQVRNIGVSAIMNGAGAEINEQGKFGDVFLNTLVSSGVGTRAANEIYAALDGKIPEKARAAIFSGARDVVSVATSAGMNRQNVEKAIEANFPSIIVGMGTAAIKTSETTKKDSKDEAAQVTDQSKAPVKPVVDTPSVSGIVDGSGFKTPEEAMRWAKSQGEDRVTWDGKVYQETVAKTVSGIPDGSGFKTAEEAIRWANSQGENKVVWNGQVFQNQTLTETWNAIESSKTFGEAYAKARQAFGPGAIFDWNGKKYSTDTKEENPSLANAQKKIENVNAAKEVAATIANDPSKIDLKNDKDTGGVFEYINQKFFNNAFTLKNAQDAPIVGGIIKAISAQQGLGLDKVGEQLKDFGSTYSLISGTPFDSAMAKIGNNFIELGKGLGSEEYNQKINKAVQDYQNLANTPRPDGLGKNNFQRTLDLWSVAKENPQGVLGLLFGELAQETIPLGGAAAVVAFAPATVGIGGAVLAATTLGAGISATLDAAEVYGNVGSKEYEYELSQGKTDAEARSIANQRAAASSLITLVTEGVADKTIVDMWGNSLAKGAPGMLGQGVRVVAANYLSEYIESWGHNLVSILDRGEALTPERLNQLKTEAQLEAIVGGKTAATLISPTIANQTIVAVAEDGSGISLAQLMQGDNKPVASINFNAPVNVLPSGDQLTLGGVTELLKAAEVGIDVQPDPSTVVYITADGSNISAGNVAQFSQDFKVSIPEVYKLISNNQLDLSSIAPKIDSLSSVDPRTNLPSGTTIDVNPDTGVTTETKVQTNPETNTTTESRVETDPNTNTTVESNVTTTQDSVVSTDTVVNNNTNTQVDINSNVDANTATATVVTTDINTKVSTEIPIDDRITSLIAGGLTPIEAMKVATEEVKDAAKRGTLNAGGGGTGVPMFSDFDSDFEHPSLFTKGPKAQFESPLETFLKQVQQREETAPEPQMQPSDYFKYGSPSEIDDILAQESGVIPSDVIPSNIGTSFRMPSVFGGMKAGGLVPAFEAGGPLTVAAGKVRRDYRQGDAVSGPGDGQSDDIPAMLADGEFVIPADVVAALGNGSNKAGADKLYEMMHSIRREHRKGKPEDLPKPAKSPLQYISRRK